MISLSPKKRFQESEAASPFRALVGSNIFEMGLTQAVAEYMVTKAPTGEQLNGVRTFIEVLLNLAEPVADMPKFPAKHISLITDTRKQAPATARSAQFKPPQTE